MSYEKKSRLEVQNVIRDNILQCINFLHKDGWNVMEFANASLQSADKIVLMNYVSHKRIGFQAHTHSSELSGFKRVDSWIEEQSWQIHCLRKRPANSDDIEETAEDMASDLVAWFNGRGCDYFRKFGMSSLRIDADAIFVYNDNSYLYQKRAVFTVKVEVPKEMKSEDIELDALLPKILPV